MGKKLGLGKSFALPVMRQNDDISAIGESCQSFFTSSSLIFSWGGGMCTSWRKFPVTLAFFTALIKQTGEGVKLITLKRSKKSFKMKLWHFPAATVKLLAGCSNHVSSILDTHNKGLFVRVTWIFQSQAGVSTGQNVCGSLPSTLTGLRTPTAGYPGRSAGGGGVGGRGGFLL